MKKFEFFIICQVLVAFNLVNEAGKNEENCHKTSFKSIYKVSALCICIVETYDNSKRLLLQDRNFTSDKPRGQAKGVYKTKT